MLGSEVESNTGFNNAIESSNLPDSFKAFASRIFLCSSVDIFCPPNYHALSRPISDRNPRQVSTTLSNPQICQIHSKPLLHVSFSVPQLTYFVLRIITHFLVP